MILLTRLNNTALMVNSDLIKFVEQAPDTVITLINGEKLLVRETANEIAARVVEFRKSVVKGLFQPHDFARFAGRTASPISTCTKELNEE